jgi:hypothetical protein
LGVFVNLWKKWWTSMQPAARVHGKGNLKRQTDIQEGWEELMKGGINGFLNVVVSLAWWYQAIKTSAQRKLFMEMVEDVGWVQDQIIGGLRSSEKRKGGPEGGDKLNVKR